MPRMGIARHGAAAALAVALGTLGALGAGGAVGAGCRRVDGEAAPAPARAGAPTPGTPASAPTVAPLPADTVSQLRRRLGDAEERLRALEATRARITDAGVVVGPPGPAGPAGPPGPTGATGPEGPPGPALRLDTVPDKHEVYRRRAEQLLEPGDTGAAVARCDGAADAVISGACQVVPGPLGVLTQAGAYGLDDPHRPAGWRCEYRSASPHRAVTARADVYCVARKGRRAPRPPASAPAPARR